LRAILFSMMVFGMLNWQRPSAVLQLAAYLRGELAQGRWAGKMPGVIRLTKELGTARNTVEGALKKLEQDGFLISQGYGKGRVIREDTVYGGKRMRVAILRDEKLAAIDGHILELQHQLLEAGYSAVLAEKSLMDIEGDLGRLESLVQRTNAAAWVVVSGTREILEWFHSRDIPVYALFGRRRELVIAGGGPDKSQAFRQVARELVARGHRRIVLIALKSRRLPTPGLPERMFLEELQAQGIATGPYNLPEWEDSPEDLQRLLDACFRVTPPRRSWWMRPICSTPPNIIFPRGASGCRKTSLWYARTRTEPSPGADQPSHTSGGTTARSCGTPCAGRPR
jgi:DNA-binding transcriptional regulator YhcF (GntR family)